MGKDPYQIEPAAGGTIRPNPRVPIYTYIALAIVAAAPPGLMIFWLLFESSPSPAAAKTIDQRPEVVQKAAAPIAAPPPATALQLSSAIEALWSGGKIEAEGIAIGPDRTAMQKALRAAFPQAPTRIEILHSPPANSAGNFTIRAIAANGHERMLAVRVIRHEDNYNPWLVDRLMVVGAPHLK